VYVPPPAQLPGRPIMLRMIRSARSRLNREPSADDAFAAAVERGATLRWPSADSAGGGEAILETMDRPLKRMSAARAMLGNAGRQRLSRSRSTLESSQRSRCSENTAPTLPSTLPAPPAPTAVLGDVTNTTGQHWSSQGQHSTPSELPCVKPSAGLKDTGRDAKTSTLTLVMTSPSPISEAVPDDDVAFAEDPQQCAEYVPDIYKHLQREEGLLLPQPDYMDRQPHVNSKMRAILIDWLVDVHKRYKLKAETLFLAISLVDRFLERRVTARRHLQLVGVTALLIAAKFEELYPPQIHEFVYVTDKTYTKEEVIRMEVLMLTVLDFKICRPTAVQFLERYQRINGCTEAHRDLAQYLLELTLVDFKMVKYMPSHLAAAAILLSNKLLRRQPSWTPAAVKHTKMPEHSLKECAKEMCGLLEQAEQSPLQAVRKKFSQLKHHAVAKLNFSGSPPQTGILPPAAPLPPAQPAPLTSDGRGSSTPGSTGRRTSLRHLASSGTVSVPMDTQESKIAEESLM
ncbi:unnamed protein product, partial [Polarella glacialis]